MDLCIKLSFTYSSFYPQQAICFGQADYHALVVRLPKLGNVITKVWN